MLRTSVKWRRQAWIAMVGIVAILLNALAPSMSHGLVRMDAAALEICSTPGTSAVKTALLKQAVQLAERGFQQDSSKPSAMMEDCGYCLVHGGTHMLPPQEPAVLAVASGNALRPFLFYHAPTPLLALSAAEPRGPPALV